MAVEALYEPVACAVLSILANEGVTCAITKVPANKVVSIFRVRRAIA